MKPSDVLLAVSQLQQGEQFKVTDWLTVYRRTKDTATGKPKFTVMAHRMKPLLSGSQGAQSVFGACRAVNFYLSR